MAADFDIAIVGSGFGGSLMAMIARRLEKSVVLIEKGTHPRFVIGESSTPIANLELEEITKRWDFPRLRPLTKWGTWQKSYPQLPCGLKRGFSFFHHTPSQPWHFDRQSELLVAASPRDAIADTHWYRPSFDHFLVQEAINEGVEYLDQVALDRPEFMGDIVRLSGSHQGKPIRLQVRFLIDATGPGQFLNSSLKVPTTDFETMPRTQALYSHFEGVRRFDDVFPHKELPPYPVDDAALHHVFPGGWIWVLRFNNGITSAGAAVTDEVAEKFNFKAGPKAWEQLLDSLPSVREQFTSAKPVERFIHAQRLSWRTAQAKGPRWVLLPGTAGFVDPLLSTGIALNLLGIERLAETIGLKNSARAEERLDHYAKATLAELDFVALLVSALYRHMGDFDMFASLSRLYFAAASYSETLRRLGRKAEGFLHHRALAPHFRLLLMKALVPNLQPLQRTALLEELRKVIEPIDIAGLTDPARRNWHPVQVDDLLANRNKLPASEDEIQHLLQQCGFFDPP
jgi:FADH2 O2-dependent halogenase